MSGRRKDRKIPSRPNSAPLAERKSKVPEDRSSEPGPEDQSWDPGTPEIIPPPGTDSEASALRTRAAVQVRTTTESYSGPLPPAAELAAYDQVHPGSANRIVVMAEQYAAHIQGLETTAFTLEGASRRRGQWLGAAVVGAVLGTCLISLDLGYEVFAIALGTGTIVSLAVVFVLGKVPEWTKKPGP